MKFLNGKQKESALEIIAISLAMVLIFTFGFGIAQTVKSVGGIETVVEGTKNNSPIDYTIEYIEGENTTSPSGVPTSGNPNDPTSVTNPNASADPSSVAPQNVIDPTGYSKAQLIEYFNTAANRVRSERPGFKYEDRSGVSNTYFAGLKGGWIDDIVNSFFKDVDATVSKGQASAPTGDPITISYFGSEQASWAAKLRASDVTSCSCSKSGNYYIVNLRLISEVNPTLNGNSAYSRCLLILTKQNVKDLAEPKGLSIQSLDDLSLSYHDGYITATIDQQGRIREMRTGFVVDGIGNNISFKSLPGTGTIKMTITKTYKQTNFVW